MHFSYAMIVKHRVLVLRVYSAHDMQLARSFAPSEHFRL